MNVVWGVDPSTKRISIAAAGERAGVWTLRLGDSRDGERLARAYDAIGRFALSLSELYPPTCVLVEQPSGKFVKHSLSYMVGVCQAAIYNALHERFEHPVSVFSVSPSEWKKPTVGKGNATKEEVMAWARDHGYAGDLQDEADAMAIATAGVVLLSAERVAA